MGNDEKYSLEELIMYWGAFLASAIFSFVVVYSALKTDIGKNIMEWIGIIPCGFSLFLFVFGVLEQIVEEIFYDE